MIVWRPPAMKIFVSGMAVGVILMYVFRWFFNFDPSLARNLGVSIDGVIMVVWDLLYKRNAGRSWDDVAVSSFFNVIPTFALGGFIAITLIYSSIASGDFSSAFGSNDFELPRELQRAVIGRAGIGADIISVEEGEMSSGTKVLCITTEENDKLEYWAYYNDILHGTNGKPHTGSYGCSWEVPNTP